MIFSIWKKKLECTYSVLTSIFERVTMYLLGALQPIYRDTKEDISTQTMWFCLCWGFTAQSTQWGHVERGQLTWLHFYWAGLVLWLYKYLMIKSPRKNVTDLAGSNSQPPDHQSGTHPTEPESVVAQSLVHWTLLPEVLVTIYAWGETFSKS